MIDLDEGDRAYADGDLTKALNIYSQAKDQGREDFRVFFNLGVLFRDLDRNEESLTALERAALMRPDNAAILNNLGIVRERMGDPGTAQGLFRGALSLDPDLASAHFNLGLLLLRHGHYEEGFARCEKRWETDQFSPFDCPNPRWDGRYVDGTVMIHTEQGAGDAMQFSRYIPTAANYCKRIMFVCPERLMPLFSNVPGVAELRTAGEFSTQSFQAYTPLLSLPFFARTTLENIPPPSDFFTPADNITLPTFGPDKACLKVGLAWAGSRTHLNDRNRSASLKDFSVLFDIPDIAFYSLQIDESATEIDEFPGQICDLRDCQNDWSEAAGIVKQLDLVIAVDTGIVHLAASMGIPTWVALSTHADWRWLTKRSDSPWYPSVTLFRQRQRLQWQPVFNDIRSALASLAEQSKIDA